jgi:uncharacterized protein DUF1501
MIGTDKIERFLKRWPHEHRPFYSRPHLSRRAFLNLAGAGLTASFLPNKLAAEGDVIPWANVETKNTAKNVIFVLMAGAPSHVDTFDFKQVNGVTPSSFAPTTVNGITWPTGLMPKMANHLGDIAIVRSMRSWALQHSGMQTWLQIGRSPTSALGGVAPNIGSVVAIEKEGERRPDQVFPTFLALSTGRTVGSGYLSSIYAPLKITPDTDGLTATEHPAEGGQARFHPRYALQQVLDQDLRSNSPLGRPAADFEAFYGAARGLMYNPDVELAFGFSEQEHARYGNSSFGDACLVAKQVLEADQGTRFIQIVSGGWDHHQDIYAANAGNKLPVMGRQLDAGLGTLIEDLKNSGLWNETLLVAMGEFGRTVGSLSPQAGRDHYLQHFGVFGGAGVTGGKVIGATNASGAFTADPGWHRERNVRIEDVEATIYSALGINWTNVRYDDPFNRGFEYVPKSKDDVYGPVHELWG